jgi:hypothetical protein
MRNAGLGVSHQQADAGECQAWFKIKPHVKPSFFVFALEHIFASALSQYPNSIMIAVRILLLVVIAVEFS